MKTDMQNIELIHNYLNGHLTEDEIKTVENQLRSDLEFQNEYNDQLALIEGVKRAGLTQEILTAKQSYYKFKWLKISCMTLSFLVIPFVIYVTFFKTLQIENSKLNWESRSFVVLDSSSVEDIEKRDKEITTNSTVVEEDIIKKPLKEKTPINPQELINETERMKVEQQKKAQNFVRSSLDSISVKIESKSAIVKQDRKFSESIKNTTQDNAKISFTDSLIGTYEMKLETRNALIIDKFTLNPDGTFEFHEYDNHEKGIPRERNIYGKGTWKIDKNLLILTTYKSDFDKKYTLDFNNTKARFISKSPRDKSNRDIKTSIQFYESEIFWIPKRTMIKIKN